jgi:hypothetical protein
MTRILRRVYYLHGAERKLGIRGRRKCPETRYGLEAGPRPPGPGEGGAIPRSTRGEIWARHIPAEPYPVRLRQPFLRGCARPTHRTGTFAYGTRQSRQIDHSPHRPVSPREGRKSLDSSSRETIAHPSFPKRWHRRIWGPVAFGSPVEKPIQRSGGLDTPWPLADHRPAPVPARAPETGRRRSLNPPAPTRGESLPRFRPRGRITTWAVAGAGGPRSPLTELRPRRRRAAR